MTHRNRGVIIRNGTTTTVILPEAPLGAAGEALADDVVMNPPSGWDEIENTLNHGTRPQKHELFGQLCRGDDRSSCFMASALAQR
jgi:hypothetical protein